MSPDLNPSQLILSLQVKDEPGTPIIIFSLSITHMRHVYTSLPIFSLPVIINQ